MDLDDSAAGKPRKRLRRPTPTPVPRLAALRARPAASAGATIEELTERITRALESGSPLDALTDNAMATGFWNLAEALSLAGARLDSTVPGKARRAFARAVTDLRTISDRLVAQNSGGPVRTAALEPKKADPHKRPVGPATTAGLASDVRDLVDTWGEALTECGFGDPAGKSLLGVYRDPIGTALAACRQNLENVVRLCDAEALSESRDLPEAAL